MPVASLLAADLAVGFRSSPVGSQVSSDPWRWQPHPEVWFLVVSLIGLAIYAYRVIGPRVVPAGQPIATRRQKGFFIAAMVVLEVAADWPLHDLGEQYLYFLHMVQHLLLSFVFAPLLLLSIPAWLAHLLLDGDGVLPRWIRKLARPVPAGIIFNAYVVFSHWPGFVNTVVRVGELHFLAHLSLVLVSLLMWMPVVSPIPEWRITLPGQMLYLFLMSVVPTVPSAWLIFADKPVYSVYVRSYHLWGITPTQDQQIAGLIMKLGGGMYLWTIITVMFFTWAKRNEEADQRGLTPTERELLQWEQLPAHSVSSFELELA